jgi:uncharacterized DUF497 family protein
MTKFEWDTTKATANQKKHGVRCQTMKTEYDLSKMKSRKNPYAGKLKKSVMQIKEFI